MWNFTLALSAVAAVPMKLCVNFWTLSCRMNVGRRLAEDQQQQQQKFSIYGDVFFTSMRMDDRIWRIHFVLLCLFRQSLNRA